MGDGTKWRDEIITTAIKPMVIEIPEDAYKQNTVYRPWADFGASSTAVTASVQSTQIKTS